MRSVISARPVPNCRWFGPEVRKQVFLSLVDRAGLSQAPGESYGVPDLSSCSAHKVQAESYIIVIKEKRGCQIGSFSYRKDRSCSTLYGLRNNDPTAVRPARPKQNQAGILRCAFVR